jgi:CDP-diacylglycerol--glycerol-3-phosphate 3-phosphatidyltransferase
VTLHWPRSDAFRDELYLIGFLAFFTVPFIIYVGMTLMGARELPAAKAGGAGRRLLGPVFIGYYYWLLGPLFRVVNRSSIRPNQITWASLVAAALTAAAIATGHFNLASSLLIGGSSLDIVDGQLARAKKMTSASGAFLDSTVDRICDGLIFGGCVVYYAGSPMMLVSLLVLIMSFTVSYARSRAEALGIVGAEGLMQRADRITLLGIALAFSSYVGHRVEGFVPHPFYAVTAVALCLLALLNTITVIARLAWTMRALKDGAHLNLVRRGEAPRVDVLRPAANDSGPLLNQRAR